MVSLEEFERFFRCPKAVFRAFISYLKLKDVTGGRLTIRMLTGYNGA
jgi:hypothetical protein